MSIEAADDGPDPRAGDEGRFAASWQNKAAGRALRAARGRATQTDFAAALSEELSLLVSPTALSGWETGRRQVPATVWIAAARVAKLSLDGLLAESGAPEVVQWIEGLGLLQRLTAVENEWQRIGELQAQMIKALAEAGLWPVPQVQVGQGGPGIESRGSRRAAGAE